MSEHSQQRRNRFATLSLVAVLPTALVGQQRPVQAPVPGVSRTVEVPTLGPRSTISLSEFLDNVDRANPDYAAQRSAVGIADAQRRVARVYPNPTFSLGYARDISGHEQAPTTSPGLSQTILLGGKIGARAAVADRTYEQTVAQLGDFERTLHANAVGAYVDALVAELAADRRRRSAEAIDRLAAGNEARYRSGDIGEADMLQSRVERQRFRADYLAAESGHQAALLALSLFMGKRNNDTIFVPGTYRDVPPPSFDLHALLDSAVGHRPDVIAAAKATEAAGAGIRLAHANRTSDLDFGVSFSHAGEGTNPIDPTPVWQGLGLSLSFTLPLSNAFNRGDLALAQYSLDQAQHQQASVLLHAENDVRQAYARFTIAVARLDTYSGTLLADAERVLTARTYSYQRGATSLTDVLVAQQALDDVYLSYYDALGEYLKALVGVRQAAGIRIREF